MKIALCMITKGDEELTSLKRAVKSVDKYVDKVCITTNAKEYKATEVWCRLRGYNHTHLPWNNDFSEQRNFNFKQAGDVDYILWMDSDDIIVNAELLPDIARLAKQKEHDAVFFTYWYGAEFDGEPSLETFVKPELNQMRERLLAPGKIVWKKRIHETPVPLDGENYSYTQVKYSKERPIAWLHLGADRDISKDQLERRNLRNKVMLKAELEDEREQGRPDPRTILYYMKVLAESYDEQELKEVIELGTEYQSLSGWDEERSLAYRLMAQAIGRLGDHITAAKYLHKAVEEYPYDPLNYLHLARVYLNLEKYDVMKHWMQIGLSIDTKDRVNNMNNILELKLLAAELMMHYHLKGDKKIRKAWEAARMLKNIEPNDKEIINIEQRLFDQKELDIASEHAHKLMDYLRDTDRSELIPGVYEALPDTMQELPLFNRYYQRFREPRVWKDNEICYFANFGQAHFEKWSPKSLKRGIGGSETAVINLSREWTKLGYKVTVYGDPGVEEGTYDGVEYLPYYKFNQRDKFNIFIQWRHNSLAKKISSKLFLVDLHDVTHSATYKTKTNQIDKIMVKSKYHRELLEEIPEERFEIISNGI